MNYQRNNNNKEEAIKFLNIYFDSNPTDTKAVYALEELEKIIGKDIEEFNSWLDGQKEVKTKEIKIEENVPQHSAAVKKNKWGVVPWGYQESSENPDYVVPIKKCTEALEQAKVYIETCSYRQVADWLGRETGHPISHQGLKNILTGKRKNY